MIIISSLLVFCPQLVILHQAVSVITSLESQVRGKPEVYVLPRCQKAQFFGLFRLQGKIPVVA